MTIFKGKSIEDLVVRWLGLVSILFLTVFVLLLKQFDFGYWHIFLLSFPVLLLSVWFISIFRSYVIASFNRALLHLDAVRLEDYRQYAKPVFSDGVVGKFHQQLRDFSDDLAQKKYRYDQHAFLVYQLIDQLETPVLVFNHKDQLTYANGAFGQFYDGQPWQRFRHAKPNLLGLVKQDAGWRLKQKEQQWQISQSSFIDAGFTNNLLLFTNIESALRSSQVNAWRQIISVMGHEIRNSLTPVSSLAESLAHRSTDTRDKEALELISERCMHLQDFISRYASLSNRIKLQCREVAIPALAESIQALFSDINIDVVIKAGWLWADWSMLQQVLINLIKNAREANAQNILLEFSESQRRSVIRIVDDGHGFANLENLFVPLYSTKQQGQGIGLSFCRNIIEQHDGTISLINNQNEGVTVTINLSKDASQFRNRTQ